MEGIISTPLTEIAYQSFGRKDGKPILCLHGWLDNSSSFEPIAPILADHGYYLVAIDFPGHGKSGWRSTKTIYSFVDFIADIKAVVDSLGWEHFSLLGHSMGGGLGSLFAGSFPEQVDKLILIEALGPVTREPSEAPSSLANAINRLLNGIDQTDSSTFRSLELLVNLRLRAGAMKKESAELLMKRGTEKLEDNTYRLRRDPRLNLPSLVRLTEEQVLEFLKRISCPVKVIWGQTGYQWEKKFLAQRIGSIANIIEVTLEGNHHLHLDSPDEVSKEILDFL
ncbi:alpha/beta fold hydrolase [Leptospira sp. GIMC2001]|uniref:alpha/beta fold hydrolase n=1 Tax=Leptospira sp. GIMC2001 TaxID=1513297 RepID=UPI00234A45DA|nr:alpha/beta hydrolase [Leptospira sp. GIMC2001]WCL47590.1 alpha/beta hydrolase [Leptospira sp. GIMC2001]